VGSSGYPFEIPKGIIQGYFGNPGNAAFLFSNRGTSSLSWEGYIDDLLDMNDFNKTSREINEIKIYRNGELESIQDPGDPMDFTIYMNDFILVWIKGIFSLAKGGFDSPVPITIFGYNMIFTWFFCGIAILILRNRMNTQKMKNK
jgi:hypothetical protein